MLTSKMEWHLSKVRHILNHCASLIAYDETEVVIGIYASVDDGKAIAKLCSGFAVVNVNGHDLRSTKAQTLNLTIRPKHPWM